jgi:hypothetical protein
MLRSATAPLQTRADLRAMLISFRQDQKVQQASGNLLQF